MRELLIRYLLGELEEHEQRHVEERLRDSPKLQSELSRLQSCFAAARDEDFSLEEPPNGLARRVSDSVCNDSGVAGLSHAAVESEPPTGTMGWSLADMTVAGGVFLAVSMLLFPALRDSRDATRRTLCQDHQRQLASMLFAYAADNGSYFPRIAPNENAGMFACHLLDKGYSTKEELAELLVCPSAPLADKIRSGEFAIRIPSVAERAAMSLAELAEVRKQMSPFFAYQFPYRDGDAYVYMRDRRTPYMLLLSDTSGAHDDMSPNHNGFVQAVSADGGLRMLQSCEVVPGGDKNLYRNARGEVAAGCTQRDVVLGRSEAMPGTRWPAFAP